MGLTTSEKLLMEMAITLKEISISLKSIAEAATTPTYRECSCDGEDKGG